MMALADLSDVKPIAPRIELKRGDGRPVTFVKHSSTDVDLDLESLASSDTIDRGRAYEGMEREASSRSGAVYEVLYVGGLRLQYPAEQSLDVFSQTPTKSIGNGSIGSFRESASFALSMDITTACSFVPPRRSRGD